MRLCASLLIVALIFASVPVTAESPDAAKSPIPFSNLTSCSQSQIVLAAARAAMNDPGSSTSQNVKKRHWSHAGKVMTVIGVPLMVAGGAMLAYGLKNGNTTVGCSGYTCTELEWKATGAAWIGIGGFLTAFGLTRRTDQ